MCAFSHTFYTLHLHVYLWTPRLLCTYSFPPAEFLSIPFFLCLVQSWLKPGGQLLISDYCCGEKPWTPVFDAYVKQRGYILYTPSRYGKVNTQPSACLWCTAAVSGFIVHFVFNVIDQRCKSQPSTYKKKGKKINDGTLPRFRSCNVCCVFNILVLQRPLES